MATKNYDFPTIDPTAMFDGANDINKIADSIDAAMKQVELLGKDAQFELKPATALRLGGVRIGANVNVASDGTISVDTDPYELPAASNTTLGGVIVPADSGIALSSDGTISINDASIKVPDNSIDTASIVDGAVTSSKIASEAVTADKLSNSLANVFNGASAYVNGNPTPLEFSYKIGDAASLTASAWGNIVFLTFTNFQLAVTSSGSTFPIGFLKNASDEPNGSIYQGAFVEYASSGAPVGLCRVYKNSSSSYALNFNGTLTAGTYEINGTAALVYI